MKASDHRFSDNLAEFDRRLLEAIAWVDEQRRRAEAAHARTAASARFRPSIGLVLFLAALEVLRVELRAVTWHELTADVLSTPPSRLGARAGADGAQLRRAHRLRLPGVRVHRQDACRAGAIALASFLAYAIANNVGFAMLSGASVRYRFYTRWGVTAEELSRIVFSYSVTFWLGLLALGGLSLAVEPAAARAGDCPRAALIAPAGWLLMLGQPGVRRGRRDRAPAAAPSPRASSCRCRRRAIAARAARASRSLDWALAGAVLYVLLPPSALPFLAVPRRVPGVAILLGMASHVPGGVGVFEGLMVLLLKPYLTSGELLPALVVYRAVYYLLPLAVALRRPGRRRSCASAARRRRASAPRSAGSPSS